MAIRLGWVVGAMLFGSVVACASIVGLDSSDAPQAAGSSSGATSSGTPDGPGSGDDGGVSQVVTNDGSVQTAAGVVIAPTDLAFQFNCGGSSAQSFTLTNMSDTAQTFEVTIDANPNFSLKDGTDGKLTGMIPAHDKATVAVNAVGTAAGSVSSDIHVKTGTDETTIGAHADIQGGMLAITPSIADFGNIHENSPSTTVNVTFNNTGTLPVTITSFTGANADQFQLPSNLTIPANGSTDFGVQMHAGGAGPAVTATLTPEFSGTVCGTVPPLNLSGRRVSDKVTVGPATLDFKNIGCGTNPTSVPAISVTIANYSINALPYNATLPGGTRFKITAGATGTVAASDGTTPQNGTITLQPITIGNAFGDVSENLTVNITGGTPATTTIPVKMHVHGAQIVLAKSPDSINDRQTKSFAYTNKGNDPISLCYRYSANTPSAWSFEADARDDVAAGGPGDIDVYFDGDSNGAYIAHADISQCTGGTVPLCGAIPRQDFQGNGQSGGQCCGHYPCPC